MTNAADNLLNNITQCALCHHSLPLGANPVLQFNPQSKILIAGQAPGTAAHQAQIPFADQSGIRLMTWLNITSSQLYNSQFFSILPMGFCYPGKAQSGDLPPIKQCADTWRKQLLSHLKNCELTILLGKHAANWHLSNTTSLTELVRQWQTLLDNNIVVLPHPSPRNNPWLKKHHWFETTLLPVLQQKVEAIIQ
ncbi:uracil-DNA glycosylase family protein [Thalassotalea sediminis]|uniref:uracil-DNA glycosylase family protein n=1 Tax=Thalassotalea sediminis TaxID=1759089 RepID=UPI002572C350|nr:uracil-DNA glycosylase family protein [Thalassotalea sediminis]